VAVEELGKPPYARCPHLRLDQPAAPCAIYEQRPGQCRRYRCAWHLGMLGPRTDRRPDQLGIVLQLEPLPEGSWRIAAYESRPGAATDERVRYLAQLIRQSKKTRHLSIAAEVHVMTYGADVGVQFATDPMYGPVPREASPLERRGMLMVFAGKTRDIIVPAAGATPASPSTDVK
jgi:Fe-S-cluster containining protein